MCIAVLGGLFALENLEYAKKWITNKMLSSCGPCPTEMYCKGEFKGILFAKFGTKGERDTAIQIMRKGRCSEGGQQVWMKPDLPIEDRVRHSFVFGVKYLLAGDWGWEEKAIWAEPEGGKDGKAGVVWVKTKQNKESEIAATLRIEDNKIVLTYGEGWVAYFHHSGYNGFVEIVTKVEEKFQAYKQNISKKAAGKSYGKRMGY